MDWAINSSGLLIMPGTQDAYAQLLRCPVCHARVYHRGGAHNRPHFAHYSGNFSRDCELYTPGVGAGANNSAGLQSLPAKEQRPVIVWRSGGSIALSLWLRLPPDFGGNSRSISIVSSLGTHLRGSEQNRSLFCRLPFRVPPAAAEISPHDERMELMFDVALRQFQLSGNFFKATAIGGTLEDREAALELGQDYIYVSQRPLVEPYPVGLVLSHPPALHQSWGVYHISLRDVPEARLSTMARLSSYFEREIVAPRPKLEILWPPPNMYDMDGTAVYSAGTNQVVLRSMSAVPVLESWGGTVSDVRELAPGLFLLTWREAVRDIAVWAHGATAQRIRFESDLLSVPDGVVIECGDASSDLSDSALDTIDLGSSPIRLEVPNSRLWLNVRVDGQRPSPLPDGLSMSVPGGVESISAGSFGAWSVRDSAGRKEFPRARFSENIVTLVTSLAGRLASSELHLLESREHALSWAARHNCLEVLPIILAKLPFEVDRGLS